MRRYDKHQFDALPKRRIVERTFTWISQHRLLAGDFERNCWIAAAFIWTLMIPIMLRCFAPSHSREIENSRIALSEIRLDCLT